MNTSSDTTARSTGTAEFYRLISLCFFLSGAAGLVYEVVWARQLSLFLGITSFAHTAVITAYMAGLAVGSVFFGRRADRSVSPLKVYAWLEVGVAAYAAFTPWMFDLLQAGYAGAAGVAGVSGMGSHLVRFSIALAALLVPTFLMGGTLPLLVRGFVRDLPELGKATSRLYGLNTIGAMTGTLLAGYFLIPVFGIVSSTFIGVLINLGIALLVLKLLKELEESGNAVESASGGGEKASAAPPAPAGHGSTRLAILAGFGLAGFASLLTQMAWIRAMILVIGGSVYAFTVTLASFLAGIGLGSLAWSRFMSASRSRTGADLQSYRMQQAAILGLAIAVTLMLGLIAIGRLPDWFLRGFAGGLHESFFLFQLYIFLLCFGVMILPTLFMGALFPLITVIWTRESGRAGQGVGAAYAINTTGTIFGALLGGLFILPWLGVHRSVELTSALYVLVAIIFWLNASRQRQPVMRFAVALGAVVLVAGIGLTVPPWDKNVMSSGAYYRPQVGIQRMEMRERGEAPEEELLYYAEGLDGTVTVKRQDGDRFLAINGKTDASSRGDIPTQVLLARLPMQMNRQIEDVLIIGLGSGITAGSAAQDKSIRELSVLEISAEVVEASDFFKPENYSVLEDPRVDMITADARNYLLATDKRFDLIVSEPSNPWISGVSNLFTAEFFELAKSRLKPGGLMAQWFHTYSMSTADMKSILGTFAAGFEHVSTWQPLPGDMVMVGSDQPHGLELGRDESLDPSNRAELERGLLMNDRDLARLFVFGNNAVRQFTRMAVPNTDVKPVIEFSAPRNLYANTYNSNLEDIVKFLGGRNDPVPVTGFLEVSEQAISARAMDLDVALTAGLTPEGVDGNWVVVRNLVEADDGITFRTDSQRFLNWSEGEVAFDVRASWFEDAVNVVELGQYLADRTGEGVVSHGLLEQDGINQGVWLVTSAEDTQHTELAMAWHCPASPYGFTRLLAKVRYPGRMMADSAEAVDRVFNRFSCRTK